MSEKPARLMQQLRFIVEIDKLKSIVRRTYLCDGTRRENSAEHSWHLAMMALVLQEYANDAVDLMRVLKMVLIHDIVEIEAGDTYLFDDTSAKHKAQREQEAAQSLFGILPQDQRQELLELWQEFERRVTPDARFANALDRLMPLLHNYYSEGRSWQENRITSNLVLERLASMGDGADALWQEAQALIADAVEKGFLAP